MLGAGGGGTGGDGLAHRVAGRRARLLDVADVEHRLGTQQVEGRELALGCLIVQVERARRASALQQGERRLDRREPILRLPVTAAGTFDRSLALPLQAFEVGEHELRLDQLDVVQGIDRTGAVRHLVVLETANQVEQGIHLAHVAQESDCRGPRPCWRLRQGRRYPPPPARSARPCASRRAAQPRGARGPAPARAPRWGPRCRRGSCRPRPRHSRPAR